MKILALDTATEACSAALLVDKQLLSRYREPKRGHADLILPMVDELLAEAGLTLRQLDAIAVGRGPGGFTGVRIGIGVAQGLAYGARLPVVPISNLAAVAQRAVGVAAAIHQTASPRVLVCMDARMHEVYWAEYALGEDGLVVPVGEERVSAPSEVKRQTDGAWIAAGTGWSAYPELAGDLDYATHPPFFSAFDLLPRASDIASLAAHDLAKGLAVSPHQALPVYLRNQVAHVSARS